MRTARRKEGEREMDGRRVGRRERGRTAQRRREGREESGGRRRRRRNSWFPQPSVE